MHLFLHNMYKLTTISERDNLLDGCGFGWTLGVGDGQGGLACWEVQGQGGSWRHNELDTTEQLN